MATDEQIRTAYRRMILRTKRTTSGCLEYQGAKTKAGYAVVRIGTEIHYGHRLAWTANHGTIHNGLYVLHGCDNRPCVNVACLHLGTHADNMAEMSQRGGATVGERSYWARLTDEQADTVRLRFLTEGLTMHELAAAYGVHHATIRRIIARETYAA